MISLFSCDYIGVTNRRFFKEENTIFSMTRYGRCMSKQEAKELKRTERLCDYQESLIPVFDSPDFIEDRIRKMNANQLRGYFRGIGVRNPQVIAFFEVINSPGEIIGPIPQTNGLKEYKIPEGTKVSQYSLVRI